MKLTCNDVALAWSELCVSTEPLFEESLTGLSQFQQSGLILDHLSGLARVGCMTTILGPSGAGKTSLLQRLFGISELHSTGSIYVDRPETKAAFITQSHEESLLQFLTVEESLYYASQLRKNSKSDRFFIYDLMSQLGLEQCEQTLVKNCSGGQKKRVAIAQELTAGQMPRLMFLDEPTSGLDSNASYALFSLLNHLCRSLNIAIVSCIHQPSYKLLETVDQVYILSKKGRCVFTGTPSELRPCLRDAGVQVERHANPMDVLIEIASLDYGEEDEYRPNARTFEHSRANLAIYASENGISALEQLADVARKRNRQQVEECIANMQRTQKLYNNDNKWSFRHFCLLGVRIFKNNIQRQSTLFLARLALSAYFAGFMIILYDSSVGKESGCILEIPGRFSTELNCLQFKTTIKKTKLLITNNQILQTTFLFVVLTSCLAPIISFSADLGAFVNEHRNAWYSTFTYYWSRNFVEMLVQLPLTYVTSLLIYWKTNQEGLDSILDAIPFLTRCRFQQVALLLILVSLISQGLGLAASAAFRQMNVAILFCISVMIFDFLFCDFFLVFGPGTLCSFVSRFSFSKFSFQATLISIYGQQRCESIMSHVIDATKKSLASSASSMAYFIQRSFSLNNQTYSDIEFVLTRYVSMLDVNKFDLKTIAFSIFHKEEGNYSKCVLVLLIHVLFWRLLALLILSLKVNPSSVDHLAFKSIGSSFPASAEHQQNQAEYLEKKKKT